jgi:hypothetical protein
MYNNGGGNGGDRTEAIERAVAVKSATALVSARITAGELKGEEAATAALKAMVDDILEIVKGDAEQASGKSPEPAKAAETDSDIPF